MIVHPPPSRCRICDSDRLTRAYRLADFDVFVCRDCTTKCITNPPAEAELPELYNEAYYRERFEYYFNNDVTNRVNGRHNGNVIAFENALRELASLKPKRGSLLDVGCGPGIFLELARRDGWAPTGMDASPFAVRYARETFNLNVIEQVNLQAANFAAAPFDVVTLWDSIEHFPDPVAQLRAVRQLLKPEGLLMLNTPNEAGLLRLAARLSYAASAGRFRYPVRKLYHRFHLHYFTPQGMQTLLRRAGLEISEIRFGLIPTVKARGTRLEKGLVRAFALLERGASGREFELIVKAKSAVES